MQLKNYGLWLGLFCSLVSVSQAQTVANTQSMLSDAQQIARVSSVWRGGAAAVSSNDLIRFLSAGMGKVACHAQEKRCWKLIYLSDSHLTLRSEGVAEEKHLHRYPIKSGGFLYVAATQAGNHGQTWLYEYWVRHKSARAILTSRPQAWGIPQEIFENEFLPDGPQFPLEKNLPAFLYLDKRGDFSAAPWTWMASRWEGLEPQVDMVFQWDGERFVKKVTRTRSP